MAKREMTQREKFWFTVVMIGGVLFLIFEVDWGTPRSPDSADVRFGLSEEQRFRAYVELQDAYTANIEIFKRAHGLADGEIWTLEIAAASDEELDALGDQSERRIEAKYGLTDEQMTKIFIEGHEKDWLLKRHKMREN